MLAATLVTWDCSRDAFGTTQAAAAAPRGRPSQVLPSAALRGAWDKGALMAGAHETTGARRQRRSDMLPIIILGAILTIGIVFPQLVVRRSP
jgi:hypothetical protein